MGLPTESQTTFFCGLVRILWFDNDGIVEISSAALAHIILHEKLHTFGILGCVLCVVGSITIVLHAPQEQEMYSVLQVWNLATEPGIIFILISNPTSSYHLIDVLIDLF